MSKPGSLTFLDWDSSHIPEILLEIYIQKIYHPYVVGKTGSIFLDLGFNIGLWSFYASKFAKTIYAFEPAKDICSIGKKNMEQNGIQNVEVYQKAVADTDGTMTLFHSSNLTMSSLNDRINDTKEKEEVETIRLDTFVKEKKIEKIDFAKIDIEGTEDKLFASESFRNIVPILDTFLYEWHTWTNANPNVINAGLRELGYTVKRIISDATLFIATKT